MVLGHVARSLSGRIAVGVRRAGRAASLAAPSLAVRRRCDRDQRRASGNPVSRLGVSEDRGGDRGRTIGADVLDGIRESGLSAGCVAVRGKVCIRPSEPFR